MIFIKKRFDLLFIIFILLFTVTGCGNKPDLSDDNKVDISNQSSLPIKLEDNIITTGAFTKRNDFVVFLKNNNSVPIDLKIEVEFYDANNQLVDTEDEFLKGVGANREIAQMFGHYDVRKTAVDYKINVTAKKSNVLTMFDKLNNYYTFTTNGVEVKLDNFSDTVISVVSLTVVYYKDKEVVGIVKEKVNNVKSGKYTILEMPNPEDSNFYTQSYSSGFFNQFKLFINEAYNEV